MIVELSKEEVRVCTMLATERWLMKFGSVDRPNYAQGKANGRLEHELTASIRANVAEWAVAKAKNLVWSMPWYPNELHSKRAHLPDVGFGVEVRTVRTSNGIPFWGKDAGKCVYGCMVLDTEYYSQVEIYGHFFADECRRDEWVDQSIGGWRVPITELKAV